MPENRDTLFRQWAMLRHIPRHPQTVSTRQIADYLALEDFKVTNRTVERDLDKLSAIFGYSSEEHGRSDHWFWPPDFGGIDIPGLEPNTALAFNLAELHLKDLLPPSTLDLLAPYFARARDVLDIPPAGSLVNWRDKIKVLDIGPQLAAPVIDRDIQRVMYAALLQEQRVNIRYERRTDALIKAYEFSPLGLVSRQGVLYMVGPFWEYDNVVQIALHRIKSAQPIDTSAYRPGEFDLAFYVSQARQFSYPTGEGYIDMVIAMDEQAALHLIERPLSADQQAVNQADGRTRINATVLDTDELTWWLLGFGASVEVLAPSLLRDRIQAALETAALAYLPSCV